MASALAREGRLEAARGHFAEVVRLDPDDPGAHRNLAQVLEDLGRTGEAVAHYRKTLRLKPDHADALNNLACILAANPDPRFRNGPEAVRLAERAVAVDRDPAFLDTLAAAYAEAGRFDDAVRTAEEALDLAREGTLATEIRERLVLYRQGKPFRETEFSTATERHQTK